MELLFDRLGAAGRPSEVNSAVATLAEVDDHARGAVYTRPEVVEAILDLCHYTPDRPLHNLRLLEPSFGQGDFLLPAIDRLLKSYINSRMPAASAVAALENAIRAVELHKPSLVATRSAIGARLEQSGLPAEAAARLSRSWLLADDFLLCHLEGRFDVVVGNPPYVRQERIPDVLLAEYRRRYRTLYDRADLYVPFFERGLDLLAPEGRLGYICANRWLKNKYGRPLREKISSGFHLTHFVDMEGMDAFLSDVTAYPAITIIARTIACQQLPTRVVQRRRLRKAGLPGVAKALASPDLREGIDELQVGDMGGAPWLLDDVPRVRLVRKIEETFPALEGTGCRVGIGVATGCDRVFIRPFDELPVEDNRKLPLVMARDLEETGIGWHGMGVVNPFEEDGTLAKLASYPRFASYMNDNKAALSARHVASRNPSGWYRTIDRITPSLRTQPKLLVPDIKGKAQFVLDSGLYYPHHNLYFITSDKWDLRALRTVMRSSVSLMIISTYCTKMSGGFLRFQAQYLRRLRLPQWSDLTSSDKAALIAADKNPARFGADEAVFKVFGLTKIEGKLVQTIAAEAEVTPSTGRSST